MRLVALDRAPQLGLERQTLQRRGVHVRVEQLVAAAARGLGAIHRDVRVAKHGIDRPRLRAADDDADAGRPEQLLLGDAERLGERLLQSLGDGAHVLGRRDVLGEHGELVAAQPRQHVAGSELRLQPLRDGHQEAVADDVAEAVVDQLEAVEVDEQHRVAGRRERASSAQSPAAGARGRACGSADPSARRAAPPGPASRGCGAAR